MQQNNGSASYPYCVAQDGYTKEVTGSEAVRIRVAKRSKANSEANSPLHQEYFKSFLDVSSKHVYI
ncbi:hypothetical protein KSP39_PZI003903 [Platanthera zijinensis]|uniref:Uncharacterized protein n=1 Tax=Platanthera zijinensis TaxID=2320716 RepID=A0AAP0BWP2_9ASPA